MSDSKASSISGSGSGEDGAKHVSRFTCVCTNPVFPSRASSELIGNWFQLTCPARYHIGRYIALFRKSNSRVGGSIVEHRTNGAIRLRHSTTRCVAGCRHVKRHGYSGRPRLRSRIPGAVLIRSLIWSRWHGGVRFDAFFV